MKSISNLRIFLDTILHLALTVIFSWLIYSKTRNLSYIIVYILVGYSLDLDHLIDYFLFTKNNFNMKDLFKLVFIRSGRVYYFLHSWELAVVVYALGYFLHSGHLLVAGISLAVHLSVDNLQRSNPFFYFLSYRILKRFDARVLLPEYN